MFYGKALSIALPIMLQQLIQNLVSLIDNFMVAGLGDVSMSGVNIAVQILFVFMIFLNTICMSGGIYLTQFFGAMPQHGHNDCSIPAAVAVHERSACRGKVRRGHRDGCHC